MQGRDPSPGWIRVILLMMPTVAALGPYLGSLEVLGANLYAFRIASVCVFSVGLFRARRTWVHNPVPRQALALGCTWFLWSLMSMFWAPNGELAIRDTSAVAFGFMPIAAIGAMGIWHARDLDALRRGWVVAFVSTALIAVWEMATGNHLPSYFTDHAPAYLIANYVNITSTFGNPNDYGGFLLLCMPFLVWSGVISRGCRKLLYGCLIVGCALLIAVTGSRISLIGLFLMVLSYATLSAQRVRVQLCVALVVTCCLVLISALGLSASSDRLLIGEKMVDLLAGSRSLETRIQLIVNGLWFLYKSAGFGVGAGGYQYLTEEGKGVYWIGQRTNPHNFAIEVLSQYGLVVFCLLARWFVLVLTLSLHARHMTRKHRGQPIDIISTSLFCGLVGYLFAGSVGSGFLKSSINWMWVATTEAMGAYLFEVVKHNVSMVPGRALKKCTDQDSKWRCSE